MLPAVYVETVIDLMVDAARAAGTIVDQNFHSFRDKPTRLDVLPIGFMLLPEEDMQSLGPNTPQYNVTWTVPIIVRIELEANPDDPQGLELQQALSTAREKLRTAILNHTPIMRMVQQIQRVTSRFKYDIANERRQGELQMAVVLQTYLGPEEMHDVDAPPLDEIALAASIKTTAGPGMFDQPFVFDLPHD